MIKNKLSVFTIFGRRGFTLTEVLLAVMIVGLIGIALASLTRASAREGGIGRSKILLRNNLSLFMRTLRSDIATASYIGGVGGELTLNSRAPVTLLKIAKHVSPQNSGTALTALFSDYSKAAQWITYCFVRGGEKETPIAPSDAYRGGAIYRLVQDSDASGFLVCSVDNVDDYGELVLNNVKYIPPGEHEVGAQEFTYPVPLFKLHDFNHAGASINNSLKVNIITELHSKPVVNDVVEEVFFLPNGY